MIGNQITLEIKNLPMALRWANKLLKIRYVEMMGVFAAMKLTTQMSLHHQHWKKIHALQKRFNNQVAELSGKEIVLTLKNEPTKDIASLEEMLSQLHISQMNPVLFVQNTSNRSSSMTPFTSTMPVLAVRNNTTNAQILINQQQMRTLGELIAESLTYEMAKDDKAQYLPCLYIGELSDDDLVLPMGLNREHAQKQVINYIKHQVSTCKDMSIADYKALSALLNNIAYVLFSMRLTANNVSSPNVKWLLLWIKFATYVIDNTSSMSSLESLNADYCARFIGKSDCHAEDLQQVEAAVAFFQKRLEFTYQVFPLFLPIVIEYTYHVENIVNQAVSDMDLIYAEQSLAVAKNLLKMQLKLPKVSQALFLEIADVELKHTTLEAKLAYKSGELNDFVNIVKSIESSSKSDIGVVEVLVLATQYYLKIDMSMAKHYLELAQNTFDLISSKDANDEKTRITALIEKIKLLKNEIGQIDRKQLIQALQQKIPGMKIKQHPTLGLILYCPLKAIPPEVIKRCKAQKQNCVKIMDVFDNQRQGDKIYTGIQMSTLSLSCDDIAKTVQAWLIQIENANSTTPAKSDPDAPKAIVKVENMKASVKPVGGAVKLIEQPEAPYQKPTLVSKEKTHKASAATVLPVPISAALGNRECHAAEFGFTLPGNPLVTPVYCSEAAQRQRRAKLFVMFKGIRGVEENVEKQFAEMLNPRPEGLLTVGMVNQAGVKLWRHPDALGDAWNLCALRFKRKGAAGWLRAIAEPEAKVTVMNSDGKQENHYLFSLGKPKHK